MDLVLREAYNVTFDFSMQVRIHGDPGRVTVTFPKGLDADMAEVLRQVSNEVPPPVPGAVIKKSIVHAPAIWKRLVEHGIYAALEAGTVSEQELDEATKKMKDLQSME